MKIKKCYVENFGKKNTIDFRMNVLFDFYSVPNFQNTLIYKGQKYTTQNLICQCKNFILPNIQRYLNYKSIMCQYIKDKNIIEKEKRKKMVKVEDDDEIEKIRKEYFDVDVETIIEHKEDNKNSKGNQIKINENEETEASNSEKSENYNKWRWLLAYIYSVTCDELKPYIYELLVNNYDDVPSSYGIEQAAIRLELNGLMQTAVITKNINGKDYSSYDYENLYDTDAKELEKFLGTNSYETGVGTVLPIPVRDGYTFMGWFDNPECDGEAVFEIPYNAYGDKQYYAKWQK